MKKHIRYKDIADEIMSPNWGPGSKYESAIDAIEDGTATTTTNRPQGNFHRDAAIMLDIARSLRSINRKLSVVTAKPKRKAGVRNG